MDESSTSSIKDKLDSYFSSDHAGLDATERGHNEFPQTTLIIENPIEAERIFSNLMKNAKEEILILFPSTSAIKRQKHFIIDLLHKRRYQKVGISIMSPLDQYIKNLLSFSNKSANKQSKNFLVREIAKPQRLKSTILMVDKRFLLTVELNDDAKQTFIEASGLSTYSTSKPTILSYVSIFDSLWNQAELYENLRITNEKLVESERVEREFINTAAHELRTPTQAIMGYLELDKELFDDLINKKSEMDEHELTKIHNTLHKHHETIFRNATRLENLINNLLDVARIDSHQKNMIMLQKERVDLVKEIKDLINFQLHQKIKNKHIKVNFINDELLNEPYPIHTDKTRLNQILNNLIDNAIKFSEQGGSLDILIYENTKVPNIKKLGDDLNYNPPFNIQSSNLENCEPGQIHIAVSDSGKGINPSILPRIFEKFITDSGAGTGLGLYICKKLVEAMGGKIWAFNNHDGIGSTFVFSLPMSETIT